jgi:hypothetical protein
VESVRLVQSNCARLLVRGAVRAVACRSDANDARRMYPALRVATDGYACNASFPQAKKAGGSSPVRLAADPACGIKRWVLRPMGKCVSE